MPTLRIACSCVLSSFILLSCQNKKIKTASTNPVRPTELYDTVYISAPEPTGLNTYTSGFISGVTQRFKAGANKVFVITAQKGLKVTVDPDKLIKADGSAVEGKIEVSIIELTNSDDLFKSNAATVSDGRLLASGGSYYIGMTCNGQQVKVKPGQSVKVDFPLINEDEMQLFYGERDSVTGNMNWKKAGQQLQQEYEDIEINTTTDYSVPARPTFKSKYHLFNSLDAKVYYVKKLMTVRELAQELQRRKINAIIDTVYYSWYGNSNVVYTREKSSLGYRNGIQYRIIPPEAICQEADSLEKATAEYQKAMAERKNNDFKEQLKKYYAPASIGTLGWINCDRFYKNNQAEIELGIPITLNNSRIDYFIIFRSFPGLLNYKLDFDGKTKVVLDKLPNGEQVTLVAFAKNKGIVYQVKQDIIIEKNKKFDLDFKAISKEELEKMFKKNIKV